jgi:hypothetical protein
MRKIALADACGLVVTTFASKLSPGGVKLARGTNILPPPIGGYSI